MEYGCLMWNIDMEQYMGTCINMRYGIIQNMDL